MKRHLITLVTAVAAAGGFLATSAAASTPRLPNWPASGIVVEWGSVAPDGHPGLSLEVTPQVSETLSSLSGVVSVVGPNLNVHNQTFSQNPLTGSLLAEFNELTPGGYTVTASLTGITIQGAQTVSYNLPSTQVEVRPRLRVSCSRPGNGIA